MADKVELAVHLLLKLVGTERRLRWRAEVESTRGGEVVTLELHTKAPSKWVVLDLDNGHAWLAVLHDSGTWGWEQLVDDPDAPTQPGSGTHP